MIAVVSVLMVAILVCVSTWAVHKLLAWEGRPPHEVRFHQASARLCFWLGVIFAAVLLVIVTIEGSLP